MGIIKKSMDLENVIMSHPVQVINWTSGANCVPCRNQDRDLAELEDVLDPGSVGIVSLPFQSHHREFSKLGNKVLPSINVFVQGRQMTFIDTKLRLSDQKGYKSKPVRSLAGARSKGTLARVIESALEKL